MARDYSKVAVQASPSNYKEELLCETIDKSNESLRWLEVVNKTCEHYKFITDKSQVIKLNFLSGYTVRQTCKTVGVSVRTFRRWQNEIFETAESWAKELRLI